jgi:hypothetical protein
VSHDSILTSLAQLERLIRKGLSLGGGTQEELDAYALALREAVESYICSLERCGGMAIPTRHTDRYFAEHD